MSRFSRYFFQKEADKYFGRRYQYVNFVCKRYWKYHSVFFIETSSCYENIEQKLADHSVIYPNTDIIIMQTEEDWFYNHDIREIRKRIKNSPNWTDDSFLITNSKYDYKISKNYINASYKPGILDLIAYTPYDKLNLKDYTKIKYHTCLTYRTLRPGRDELINLLLKYKSKCSVLHYIDTFVDNINSTSVKQSYFMDAPFVSIKYDTEWAEQTAFITAIETFNHYNAPHLHKLMPTLSEKTFKAFHLNRPALIFGGKGTRHTLRKLGFDTWDWLINWEFDEIDDGVAAFECYKHELDRLLNIDIDYYKRLLKKHSHSLDQNRNRLFYMLNNYQKDL